MHLPTGQAWPGSRPRQTRLPHRLPPRIRLLIQPLEFAHALAELGRRHVHQPAMVTRKPQQAHAHQSHVNMMTATRKPHVSAGQGRRGARQRRDLHKRSPRPVLACVWKPKRGPAGENAVSKSAGQGGVHGGSRCVLPPARGACSLDTGTVTWTAPPGWRKTREQVFATKGRRCWWCGRPAGTVDHVVPVVLGGGHGLANLVPSCARCNYSRGAATGNRLGPPRGYRRRGPRRAAAKTARAPAVTTPGPWRTSRNWLRNLDPARGERWEQGGVDGRPLTCEDPPRSRAVAQRHRSPGPPGSRSPQQPEWPPCQFAWW